MAITPFRLVITSIVILIGFYLCHQASRVNGSLVSYKLYDGCLVTTIQSRPFIIGPLTGVDLTVPNLHFQARPKPLKKPVAAPGGGQENQKNPPPAATSASEQTAAGLGSPVHFAPDQNPDIDNIFRKSARTARITVLASPPTPSAPTPSPSPKEEKPVLTKKIEKTDRNSIIRSVRSLAGDKPEEALKKISDMLAEFGRKDTRLRASLFYWKGKAHRKLNEPISALDAFKKAVTLWPDNARFRNGLAWALVTVRPKRFRSPGAALPHAEKAVQLTKGRSANYLDTLAKVLYLRGEVIKAFELQKKAHHLAPKNRYFKKRLETYKAALIVD